ncbi:MAG: hypothetical protein M1815_004812 [Lichina confinis]|nr:MAG: hypothetical protein M1815_004812 [Lichina confinis]
MAAAAISIFGIASIGPFGARAALQRREDALSVVECARLLVLGRGPKLLLGTTGNFALGALLEGKRAKRAVGSAPGAIGTVGQTWKCRAQRAMTSGSRPDLNVLEMQLGTGGHWAATGRPLAGATALQPRKRLFSLTPATCVIVKHEAYYHRWGPPTRYQEAPLRRLGLPQIQ